MDGLVRHLKIFIKVTEKGGAVLELCPFDDQVKEGKNLYLKG